MRQIGMIVDIELKSHQNRTEHKGLNASDIIPFVRKKDYKFVKDLGQGACGRTVLLFDELINEQFVCKKYAPLPDLDRSSLFVNFVQEIKLLHLVHHANVVRVFNYYLYPDLLTGFILMEFIDGYCIDDYLAKHPENINEIFSQTIEGFYYLEKSNILHRDIRAKNIMVTSEGQVKIIDFGFGKSIFEVRDFEKSVSLNWWCERPNEFANKIYDFQTELYFVGKLFEKIIEENGISQFQYKVELDKMCAINPINRAESFNSIRKSILEGGFVELDFSPNERASYQIFANSIWRSVSQIESQTVYFMDVEKVLLKLEDLYRRIMLEEYVPNRPALFRCFLDGGYTYNSDFPIRVIEVKSFIKLLKSSSVEKRNIILYNLHSRFDGIERYNDYGGLEIPF